MKTLYVLVGIVLAAASVPVSLAAAQSTTAPAAFGRSVLDVKNRFLDGSIDASKAKLRKSVVMLASFEDDAWAQAGWEFSKVAATRSEEHVTEGKYSLKMVFEAKGAAANFKRGSDYFDAGSGWSLQVLFNDEARLDVFNPQDRAVKLNILMGKVFHFDLKPGKNELVMPTTEIIDPIYRSSTILQRTKISVDEDGPVTLFLDNFRFVGPGMGENLIKYGKVFQCDSGPTSNKGSRENDLTIRPYCLRLDSQMFYTKELGYGLERLAAPVRLPTMDVPSNGRQPHPQLIRGSMLRMNEAILVDLPDGKYRVQWVDGAIWSGADNPMPGDCDVSVKVGGTVTPIRRGVTSFEERVRYFNGRDRVDYMPGQDKWTAYMSDWFSPWECDVTVKGGQLRLEFVTNPPGHMNLTFMLLYPVDKASVIEPEVAALWQDIRYRFNRMAYQEATIEQAQAARIPGLHDEFIDPAGAKKRRDALRALPAARSGLVAFSRDCVDEVFPDTVPKPEDLTDKLSAFGPAGEIVSLPINLLALMDIHELTLQIGELTSADGKKIPPAACDLRFARYEYRMAGQQGHGDFRYMIMPWYLVQRDHIEMADGMSVRWWLNVDVPAGAAPGKYTAQAKVSGKGISPKELQLTVEVLPIRLDALPKNIEYSTNWAIRAYWGPPMPDGNCGYVGPGLAVSILGKAFDRIKAEFTLMKRYGLNQIYYHPNMTECVPKFNYDGLPPETKAIIRAQSILKPDGSLGAEEVWNKGWVANGLAMNGQRPLNKLTESEVQKVKAQKNGEAILFGPPDIWCSDMEESGIYRFCAGFLNWRIGATGAYFEPWASNWGDPYHPFDGHSGEWGSLCVPSSKNWPTLNPSVMLEGIREGILDRRYVLTLQRLADENPTSPAAAKAKEYIKELHDGVKPEGAYYFEMVGSYGFQTIIERIGGWDKTWHQKDTAWKGEDYAKARQKIASLIAEFQTQSR